MKKANVYRLCDYVLGSNFEYDGCCGYVQDCFSSGMSRKEVRENMKDHIWYIASEMLNGKREAGKALTEMINDAREIFYKDGLCSKKEYLKKRLFGRE